MNLDKAEKIRIENVYGERSRYFIENYNEIYTEAVKRWKLYDIKKIEIESVNMLYYAKSDLYNDVVLKLGSNKEEITCEAMALNKFGSDYIKVYDYTDNAMIIERVRDGISLKELGDNSFKEEAAVKMIKSSPMKIDDKSSFPTYKDWMDGAFSKALENKNLDTKIRNFIDKSFEYFEILNFNEDETCLLHGDLHHMNILRDGIDKWKIIDPKGVIGMDFMESARFLNNHFFLLNRDNIDSEFDSIIKIFAKEFGVEKIKIAVSLFILNSLSIAWFLESKADDDTVRGHVENNSYVLEYIEKLIGAQDGDI